MSTSFSRRSSGCARGRPTPTAEANENEIRNPVDQIAAQQPLRSPLVLIQEPSPDSIPPDYPVKASGLTPKSLPTTPVRPGPRSFIGNGSSATGNAGHLGHYAGGKDRGRFFSSRVSRETMDADALVPVEIPHFELNDDPNFWKDHNVQVLIRIRPVNGTEVALQGYRRCLLQESSQSLISNGHPETRFTFDHVACESISQEKLFQVVGRPMVENCMSGYNSCMFAYGQTGTGKTYTMMGEIWKTRNILSDDRGITPRIFEYLFARIREEEDSRSTEKLRYSCKCSLLEIYNEQITDLLEPSSSNLQLREDIEKGVYVENLKEYQVSSVRDVIELLLQGSSNRKMAATHMNSESSRSHSVFTCVIESRWERNSMSHLRYERLNLVDLAGSERQKSSVEEGERLREAANINRSLSTLGLVIMTLVDIANGKIRHVPYRDSRLTFLLQDSLGGNSKTTIVANVSPSICCVSETLSTLKFAQRAKLIQNNAKVNEDASGDVMSLQQQIQKLKDQLTLLTKHQDVQRSLGSPSSLSECGTSDDICNNLIPSRRGTLDASDAPCYLNQKIKNLEDALSGALMREKMAEVEIRRLESEIMRMNLLKEDENQRTKLTLRLDNKKIRRSKLLLNSRISADEDLVEEDTSPEIQRSTGSVNSHFDLTQFVQDNLRLLEQLRMFQQSYQQEKNDLMLMEVSRLRNQLLDVLEGEFTPGHGVQNQASNNDEYFNGTEKSEDIQSISEVQNLKQVYHKNQLILEEEAQDGIDIVEHHIVAKQTRHDTIVHALPLCTKPPERIGDSAEQTVAENLDIDGNNLEKTNIVNMQLKNEHLAQKTWKNTNDEMEKKGKEINLQSQEEVVDVRQEAKLVFEPLLLGPVNEDFNDRICLLTRENIRLSKVVSNRDAEMCDLSEGWEKAITNLTHFLIDGCKSLEDATGYFNILAESFPQGRLGTNEHLQRAIKVFFEKEWLIADLQKRLDIATQMGLEMNCKINTLKGATLAITEGQHLENDKNFEELCLLKELIAKREMEIQELEFLLKSTENRAEEAEKCSNAAFSVIKKLYEKCALDSLDLREIKLMVRENIKEKSVEQNTESWRDCDPSKYESHIFNANLSDCYKLKTPDEVLALSPEVTTISNQVKHNIRDINIEVEMAAKETFKCYKALYTSCRDVQNYMNDLISGIDTNLSAATLDFNNLVHEIHDMSKNIKELKEQNTLLPITLHFPMDHAQDSESILSMKQSLADGLVKIAKILGETKIVLDSILRTCSESTRHKHENSRKDCQVATMSTVYDPQYQYIDYQDDDNSLMNRLKNGIQLALSTLTEVQLLFPMLFNKSHSAKSSGEGVCPKRESMVLEGDPSIHASAIKEEHIEETVGKNDVACHKSKKQVEETETKYSCQEVETSPHEANELLIKFEQAQETMAEAEHVLQALLKAHDEVKNERDMWRKVGEDEQAEKLTLVEEIRNLEALKCAGDNQIDHEQSHEFIAEALELISSVDRSFQCTKMIIHEEMYSIYSDVSSFGEECLRCIATSRSSLKDMLSAILSKESARSMTSRVLNSNASLAKELARKDEIINGLLFDIRILQESTSNIQDLKEEKEEIAAALSKLDYELEKRTSELDTSLSNQKMLAEELAKSEEMLSNARSEIEHAKNIYDMLSAENSKLRLLLEVKHDKNAQMEELLEEKEKVIDRLEKEILTADCSKEGCTISTVKEIMDEIRRVSKDREHLQTEIMCLNDKLEMAMALVDEKEAIAVEISQVSEANRVHAEEKEEEVRILEYSIQELEGTIDVLEKKVSDMKKEVESHELIRRHLEYEVQVLKERIYTAENAVEQLIRHGPSILGEGSVHRPMDNKIAELCEARSHIKELEMEITNKEEEIKQQQKYISELIFHSEAQSSLYHGKFRAMEEMMSIAKTDEVASALFVPNASKTEIYSRKTRGSSPFRCISTLVQQMNSEKEHELSLARHRIEELEALSSDRQKEICQLTARIAAVDSMTHDVIRDLLGIKLDLNQYSNLLDEEELQKLLAKAYKSVDEVNAKDMEILSLKKQICRFIEERESLEEDISQRRKDLLENQMMLEYLQQRDQLVTAQNQILKIDKANLQKRISKVDIRPKMLDGSQSNQDNLQ